MLLLISTALAAPQGNNSDSSGYLDYSGIIYERSAISNSLVEDRAINTCGCAPVSSTDRIVGGKEVNPKGKLPYQVMFFPCAPSGQCGLCGGTIVNKKFIITAAHCWDSRMTNLRVVVGEHWKTATPESLEARRGELTFAAYNKCPSLACCLMRRVADALKRYEGSG